MTTAGDLANILTPSLMKVVQPGEQRPVLGLEVVEAAGAPLEHGDLALAVGSRDVDDVMGLLDRVQEAAGIVLRQELADSPPVLTRAAEAGLPLLAIQDGVSWTTVMSLLYAALGQGGGGSSLHPELSGKAADPLYRDIFDIADTISAIVDAPVTIEDARSRVLAYSSGQHDVDQARMSTIVGRQVPSEVRNHFRARGVFRRLATSDEPFFVPAGEKDVKPRYIIPVRAGQEWLGSVWAVVDAPVPASRSRDLRAAADLIGLYLLRLRAQGELHRQVRLDQIRSVIQGAAGEWPYWMEPGEWRVAGLGGPDPNMSPEIRCELWTAMARRHGWRRPLIADLDGVVYALLRGSGREAGTVTWLADVARHEARGNPAIVISVGLVAETVSELSESYGQAGELIRLFDESPGRPVILIEETWAPVVLARAVEGLERVAPISPLVPLMEHEREHGGHLVDTLEAVIDHWGEPKQAARVLGVHPNTVRYRINRLTDWGDFELEDPLQRLALRLEIARLRKVTSRGAR